MATKTKQNGRKRETSKKDVYALITEQIIAELERGVVPWRKPWKAIDAPQSFASKRPYRGINVLLLSLVAQARGYSSPYWATYKQIAERGGQVRKGEKATTVILWKWVAAKKDDAETDAGDEQAEPGRRVPFLRYYSVFNTDQADGLEVELPKEREHSPLETAESIVAGYPAGPELRIGGDEAFYAAAVDVVGMPRPESFVSGERYYAALFHELAHSTGHEKRIDRKLKADFGSESYSREELVAEIAACFLLSEADVELELEQPAAYIANWLSALRDDPKLVVNAAAGAQKAADWILDRKPETA